MILNKKNVQFIKDNIHPILKNNFRDYDQIQKFEESMNQHISNRHRKFCDFLLQKIAQVTFSENCLASDKQT